MGFIISEKYIFVIYKLLLIFGSINNNIIHSIIVYEVHAGFL